MGTSLQFYRDYYGALLGARILKVELTQGEYEGQYWPTFTVKTKATRKTATRDAVPAQTLTVEVSQDEEGNGPGFLFGLPHPKQPEQVIDDRVEVDPKMDGLERLIAEARAKAEGK